MGKKKTKKAEAKHHKKNLILKIGQYFDNIKQKSVHNGQEKNQQSTSKTPAQKLNIEKQANITIT